MKRRLFLFAAPAIVAAPSLMRVSAAHQPLHTVWDLGRVIMWTTIYLSPREVLKL